MLLSRIHPWRRRLPLPGVVAGSFLVVAVLSSCGGGEVVLPKPLESAERGASAAPGGDGQAGDFCGVLRNLATMQSDNADEVEVLESLAAAGDSAPEELRPAFATLADVVEKMQSIDPEADDYFEKMFEIAMDPDVQEAADRIDDYAVEECGVELDDSDTDADHASGDTTPVDTAPTGTTPGAKGDINLEYVDAILEKHKPAAWAEALNFTTIMMDTDVMVATGSESGTGMSVADAMEACEALRSGLVSINPDVTVEVRDGETPLAKSPAGGGCAPA